MSDDFVTTYLDETVRAVRALDGAEIAAVATGLARVRDGGGRLFILGVGGSAAHASHAVNDFRKLCGFEAYTPTDNVAELSARVNDEGWDTSFAAWLEVSRLGPRDAVLVFSVGGGDKEKNISANLVRPRRASRRRPCPTMPNTARPAPPRARARAPGWPTRSSRGCRRRPKTPARASRRAEARHLQPLGEAGVPALVVHARGQLRHVVGRRVGLEAADLAEVVDRVAGVARRAADAEDEQPPALVAHARQPGRHARRSRRRRARARRSRVSSR